MTKSFGLFQGMNVAQKSTLINVAVSLSGMYIGDGFR
jgi:hypothetical protein